ALHKTMSGAVENGGEVRQLALINAHPELAGKAAVRGELTAESTREQSGAGLDQCTQEEFDKLLTLNRTYREKFGFPFILAVRGYDRHGIIANFESRVNHSRTEELRTSLDQIYRIARFRLDDLIDA
ncbi:2-oxo-4-hydroxy-4-carboxy-5-ureidoimidazoline decarboxylase, partial [Bacillus velezensis]|nr:2-oxo-4-hydroxy-4-carboxy-5-ureidoimidazoline decarboxylase [Bacillus velezensis]